MGGWRSEILTDDAGPAADAPPLSTWKAGIGLVFAGDEVQECAAGGNQLNQAQHRYKQDGRLKQCRGTKEKEIEGRDVHNDWAQNQQTEMTSSGNRHKKSAEDFQNFDKGQEATEEHSAHKHSGRRAFGRLGYGDELQKEIQPEYDKNEAQKAGSEVVDLFHGFDWILLKIKKKGIGP